MDTKALIAGSIEEKLLEEISDGIQASGIELQLYHAEAAPGQVTMPGSLEFLSANIYSLKLSQALSLR